MLFQIIAIAVAVLAQTAPDQPRKAPSPSAVPKAPAVVSKGPGSPVPKPVLRGTVVDQDGRPIERVLVTAVPRIGVWRPRPATARTDAKGGFALELERSDSFTVTVDAAGFAPKTVEGARPGSPLRIEIGKGLSIEGIVRDAVSGRPIAKARVQGGRPHRPPHVWEPDVGRARAVTDAAGRFRLHGLEPGPVEVSASAVGYGWTVVPASRFGRPVDMKLRPGASVTGRVFDSTGRPVAKAVVRLEPENPGSALAMTGPAILARTGPERTDAQGAFAFLGVPAYEYRILARHPDFGLGLSEAVHASAEGNTTVEVRLATGARIAGRLVSPEGTPLAGRARIVRSNGEPATDALSDVLRGDAGNNGVFRIEGVPPGSHAMELEARGFKNESTAITVRGNDAQLNIGDLVLQRGLSIRGRVRDRSGEPIAGAGVEGFPEESGHLGSVADISHADGSFALAGLEAGTYSLHARREGFGLDQKTVTAGTDGVELVLAPTGSVTGFVVDESGKPIEYFRVSAQEEAPEDRRLLAGAHQEFADGSGRFLLPNIPGGSFTLEVSALDKVMTTLMGVDVVPGRSADVGTVQLSAGGTLRGVVVDRNGTEIEGAAICARPAGDWRSCETGPTAQTDASGGFEMRGLPAGLAEVTAKHPDFTRATVSNIEIAPSKGPSEVRIELGAGGRIEGTARGRDGSGMKNAFIVLQHPPSRGRFQNSEHLPIAADGAFAVDHVAPGPATVLLMMGGQGRFSSRQQREVEVGEGETVRVDFAAREILVSGRVTRSGSPLAGARVEISADRGMSISMHFGVRGEEAAAAPQTGFAVSREDGSYELLVDQPGEARVEVTAGDFRTWFLQRKMEIPDADTFTLDLDLTGVTVRGVVVDATDDSPLSRASRFAVVSWTSEGTPSGRRGSRQPPREPMAPPRGVSGALRRVGRSPFRGSALVATTFTPASRRTCTGCRGTSRQALTVSRSWLAVAGASR